MELTITRGFLRTTAEVAQRAIVTSDASGSWRAYGEGPRWIRVLGSIALPAPGPRGLLGRERIQDWLRVVSLQQPGPVGLNESALMTENA